MAGDQNLKATSRADHPRNTTTTTSQPYLQPMGQLAYDDAFAPMQREQPLMQLNRMGDEGTDHHFGALAMPSQVTQPLDLFGAHNQYLHQTYQQPAGTGSTPNYASGGRMDTMAILGAESYNNSESAVRAHRAGKRGLERQQENLLPFGFTGLVGSKKSPDPHSHPGDERRSKRQKTEPASEEDDTVKRSRGRPRLEPKDETAADRRRTQIRNAQRAYRNRKESTISTLERQVQELKGANEEMSNVFTSLKNVVIQRDIMQREPEFAQHFQTAIDRFVALSKVAVPEEMAGERESESVDPSTRGKQSVSGDDTQFVKQPPKRSRRKSPKAAQESTTPLLKQTESWEYEIPRGQEELNQISSQSGSDQRIQDVSMTAQERQGDYQVVSRPNFDNASFNFNSDVHELQQYRAEIPSVDWTQFFPIEAFTVEASLPPPTTYSSSENSFARRLHRATIETGFRIISDHRTDPGRLHAKFGFVLNYDTKEQIIARLRKCIQMSGSESLQEWKQPFVHLGGSGTYYPHYDIGMPKLRTGMSVGPFKASVIDTREKHMLDDMHIKYPGFEGEWFDSNDIEGYLRGRGIDIPPNADFVTISLDSFVSSEISSSGHSSSISSGSNTFSPLTPTSPALHINNISDFTPQNPQTTTYEPRTPLSNASLGKVSEKPFDLSGPIFNTSAHPLLDAGLEPVVAQREPSESGKKKTVTISVALLIEQLITHASACLGRGPGFQIAAVDAAIRNVMKAANNAG